MMVMIGPGEGTGPQLWLSLHPLLWKNVNCSMHPEMPRLTVKCVQYFNILLQLFEDPSGQQLATLLAESSPVGDSRPVVSASLYDGT